MEDKIMSMDNNDPTISNLSKVAGISEGMRSTKEGTNLERTGSAPSPDATVTAAFRPKGPPPKPQQSHLRR